jgi:hypothetical protein
MALAEKYYFSNFKIKDKNRCFKYYYNIIINIRLYCRFINKRIYTIIIFWPVRFLSLGYLPIAYIFTYFISGIQSSQSDFFVYHYSNQLILFDDFKTIINLDIFLGQTRIKLYYIYILDMIKISYYFVSGLVNKVL